MDQNDDERNKPSKTKQEIIIARPFEYKLLVTPAPGFSSYQDMLPEPRLSYVLFDDPPEDKFVLTGPPASLDSPPPSVIRDACCFFLE